MGEVQALMDSLVTSTAPFAQQDRAAIDRAAKWVRPELVCEVHFGEWTPDGKVRHASFKGTRVDKPASTVAREKAVSAPRAATGGRHATKAPASKKRAL